MGDFGGAGSSFLNDSGISMTPSAATSAATAGKGAFLASTGGVNSTVLILSLAVLAGIYLVNRKKR